MDSYQRYRQTNRQTNINIDIFICRQKDKQTDRQTYTNVDKFMCRQIEKRQTY